MEPPSRTRRTAQRSSAGSVNRRPRIPARISCGLAYDLHPSCRHPTPTGKHAQARSHRVPRGSSPPIPTLDIEQPRETPCDLRSARWRDCLTASPISGDGMRAARLRLGTRKKHGRLNESAPHPDTSPLRPFNRGFPFHWPLEYVQLKSMLPLAPRPTHPRPPVGDAPQSTPDPPKMPASAPPHPRNDTPGPRRHQPGQTPAGFPSDRNRPNPQGSPPTCQP